MWQCLRRSKSVVVCVCVCVLRASQAEPGGEGRGGDTLGYHYSASSSQLWQLEYHTVFTVCIDSTLRRFFILLSAILRVIDRFLQTMLQNPS